MKDRRVGPIQYWRRIDMVLKKGGGLVVRPVHHFDARHVSMTVKELLSCSGSVCNGIFVPDLADLLALLIFQPSLLSVMSFSTLDSVTWIEIRDHRLVLKPESSDFLLVIGEQPMRNTMNVPRD